VAATKGITTCHSLRQPVFVGHRHSGQAQLIGMKLKECSNLFYSLETRENCQSYSKRVYCPQLVEEERNEVCYGSLIHGSDILVKIIIYELESKNDAKARITIKRDSEEHDLDSKFTRLDSPNYYSRLGAHVAFCNEMDFHSLGLFIYTSFRISCLISFRNRKGREIFFLFKHLALGTGITLQSISDIDNRPEGQLESRFSSRSSDRPLRNTINYK